MIYRNFLASRSVHVLAVLPGIVTARMTERMDLSTKLTAEPREVADAIKGAVERKTGVIYVRPIWRSIMLFIRNTPEHVFKRIGI